MMVAQACKATVAILLAADSESKAMCGNDVDDDDLLLCL